jgi:S1-C subfamily serine protease
LTSAGFLPFCDRRGEQRGTMNAKTIMSMLAIVPVMLCRAETPNSSASFFPLLCCSNRTYTNAIIKVVAPATTPPTVTIFCDDFHERISITNLPRELQSRYAPEAEIELETQADIDRLKSTLGPPAIIRIAKMLPDHNLQIDVESGESFPATPEACIHNLPAHLTALMEEIHQTETNIAHTLADFGGPPIGAPGQAPSGTDQQVKATAALIENLNGEAVYQAKQRRARDAEWLKRFRARLAELRAQFEPRSFIIARPTAYVSQGIVRQWEFESENVPGTNPDAAPEPARRASPPPSAPAAEREVDPSSSEGQPALKAAGTGFFITDDGFLITNGRLVKGAAKVRLVTLAGTMDAKVVQVDAANDLALLKADGSFSSLPIAASRSARLGSAVLTIGFPDPILQGFSPKLAKGKIAALSGAEGDAREFQITVPAQPGNSGGALLDERGNVVGVMSASFGARAAPGAAGAAPESVNYAIKSSLLLSFLESALDVSAKLKGPLGAKQKMEDVARSAQQAAALVLVY